MHRGEIFGLLGPNGAGKTTTAGMLTTRVIPTSGRAFVGGVDVVAHPTAAKQVIGVVPQTNTLDRSLDRLGEPLLPRPLLRDVGARPRKPRPTGCSSSSASPTAAKEPVAALSGGMAQRLMVARAIMHRPAMLFLDEPTAGLDPQSRIALWEILGELHADGQTILLTTHYMEEADELCRPARDHRPRAAARARARPAELKRSIGADTIVTVTAAGDLDALASVLEAEVAGRAAASTRVDIDRARRGAGAATACCRRCSPPPSATASTSPTCRSTEPTLETVFINLTGKDLRE